MRAVCPVTLQAQKSGVELTKQTTPERFAERVGDYGVGCEAGVVIEMASRRNPAPYDATDGMLIGS